MIAMETGENQILADLIGARVEVWTVGGDDDHYDSGTLEAVELPWVRLNVGRDKIMIFSVYQIRLIKLLERPKTLMNTLLRPAMPRQLESKTEE